MKNIIRAQFLALSLFLSLAIFSMAASASCTYGLSPTTRSISSAATTGTIGVNVTASFPDLFCSWSATSDQSWLTVTSGFSGLTDGTVGYSVAANSSFFAGRTGHIFIAGQTFTITQDHDILILCLSTINAPTTASFGSAGGSGSVSVTTTSTCSWTGGSDVGWIHVALGPFLGTGSPQSLSYTVDANFGVARTGHITVGSSTYTVSQSGGLVLCLAPSIFPTSQTFTANGGGGSVSVTYGAGCSWTAVSNNTACIYSVSPGSGSGNGTVNYLVAGNAGGTTFDCTMTIAGNTFTVTLGGCTFALAPSSASYGASGGSSSVALTASGFGCIWNASSDAAWLTLTSAASGSGSNPALSYSVAANGTGVSRTGHITAGGQTFTVTQSASSASICTAVNVYRYRNTGILGHFYTTSLGEGSALIAAGEPLVLEGPGFAACSGGTTAAGIFPVERFKHLVVPGVYFYSMIPSEIDTVRTSFTAILQDQGIAFYTFNFQPAGTFPVYRFRNTTVGGANFYTIIPSERDFIIANFPGYAYEGIGFWAMPPF